MVITTLLTILCEDVIPLDVACGFLVDQPRQDQESQGEDGGDLEPEPRRVWPYLWAAQLWKG